MKDVWQYYWQDIGFFWDYKKEDFLSSKGLAVIGSIIFTVIFTFAQILISLVFVFYKPLAYRQ